MSGSWKDDPWRRLPTAGGRIESARNLIRNSLRPSYLPVVIAKVKRRLGDRERGGEAARAAAWCEAHVEDDAAYAQAIDARLWAESLEFAVRLHERARTTLAGVKYHLGGGGHYALLYFLTRHLRPTVVVETGVAAGWSSEAILTALERNGAGTLHSSDFPMVRLADPESYIGVLVRPEHRGRWDLHVEGDARNLPAITGRLAGAPIDLVHYDSDKTVQGRREALRLLTPSLRPGALIVMDDIQDNLFFAELVADRQSHVFRFDRKFLGLAEWT